MTYRRLKCQDFEITKREILASISIVAIMLIIGLVISSKISEWQMDKNEIYNKAVKIESSELFQYGMKTNVGNAFVYGELKAIDTVTYPEIDGSYMYIEKVKEKYTMHTRTVTKHRTVNGKTQSYTTTETYWSWDRVDSEDKKCKEVTFCETIFPSSKICLPTTNYIETIKESSNVRYKYYGIETSYKGTIFTDLRNNTISNKSPFYANMDINAAIKHISVTATVALIIFWIVWIGLIVLAVFLFYKAENKWLE